MLDGEQGVYLSSVRRRDLLSGLPVRSVPVLREAPVRRMDELVALVGPSPYKGGQWRKHLRHVSRQARLDAGQVARETDPTDLMEGLYVKVEEQGQVVERYKYVRAGFLTSVVESGSHWLQRPIVPNQLAPGVELFE